MVFKKKSNNFRLFFYSKWMLVLLFPVLAGTIFMFAKATIKKRQVESEIDALKKEIEKLEGRNGDILSLLENFNEKDYLEQEARLRLNLKKKGEDVAVIIPETGKTAGEEIRQPAEAEKSETSENEISKSESENKTASVHLLNLERWFEYFAE